MYYITQALVKGSPTRGIFEIEFKTEKGVVKTHQLRSSQKSLPKLIQIKVFSVDDLDQIVIPTFFDFSSRCKKCGRFYKVYCKKCYKEFEQINMIMERFAKELKTKEDFSDFYKTKGVERDNCDPAPAGPQEE